MKFGKTDNIDENQLLLPKDHPETTKIFKPKAAALKQISIGCPQWSKAALPNFYPRGTKDFLAYYATIFNSVELNAFYYRIFPPEVVQKWYNQTPGHFRFYPKIPQVISQFRRLKNCQKEVDQFLTSISCFGEKLGGVFLQMPENYSSLHWTDLQNFLNNWVKDVPLYVELRNESWYADQEVNDTLCHFLRDRGIGHVITDTPARRDLLHMRLTTPKCFIRFTGANHPSDFNRLDDWFERLTQWKAQGLEEIAFFIHQEVELDLWALSQRLHRHIEKNWEVD
jgi:uncharacterized protein YecE (DUF72 family)